MSKKKLLITGAVALVCIGYSKASCQNCQADLAKYNQVYAWYKANKSTRPAIPVPPVITPDCTQCGDITQNNGNQKIVDNFINKSVQPEEGYVNTILQIASDKIRANAGGNVLPYDHYGDGNANACWNKMPDDQLQAMLQSMASRLNAKAMGVVQKYKTRPELFLSGLKFYLPVMRYLMLLGYTKDDGLDQPSIKDWAVNYYNQYKTKLLQQHQYQLYPGIIYLPRTIQLLNPQEFPLVKIPASPGEPEEYTSDGVLTINKAIAFMHFNLKFRMEASGHGQNGGEAHCVITGQKEIFCEVTNDKNGNPCYQWVGEGGNSMKLKVEQMEFESKKGKMTYKSPTEFEDNMQISVDLCDASPQFALSFTSFGPKQENYTLTTPQGPETMPFSNIISTIFSAVVADQSIDKFKKLEGQENNLQALADRAQAHVNDPKYWNTPQGKKDKAQLQQLQNEFGTIGPGAGGSHATMTAVMARMNSPFKLGSAMPVNTTIKAKLMTQNPGWDDGTITLTLQETPDSRDNIKL